MNKSTNIYRRCPNCPHHTKQIKCCCRKQSKPLSNVKKTQKNKKSLINQSSIHLPYHPNPSDLSSILSSNLLLKQQNSQLCQNLLQISHFINQQKLNHSHQSIQKQTNDNQMTQRLYHSNLKLKEVLGKVDRLGRENQDYKDRNNYVETIVERLRMENQQLKHQLTNINHINNNYNHNKNHNSAKRSIPQCGQCRVTTQKYQNLKHKYNELTQQNERLENIIQQKTRQTRESRQSQSSKQNQKISSQWINSTSNKLNFIQHNLPNILSNQSHMPTNSLQSQLNLLKTQLLTTISFLHTKTHKYTSYSLPQPQQTTLTKLIFCLVQNFVENCVGFGLGLEKELVYKVKRIQNKVQAMCGRLQNFLLTCQNRQIRKRSTSRSAIKHKIVISQKSPVNYKEKSQANYKDKSPVNFRDKENYNTINSRIDKTC